jgi:hypothetical protein
VFIVLLSASHSGHLLPNIQISATFIFQPVRRIICLPRPCGALCSAYDFGLLRRPRCHPRISVKWALKKEEVGEIDRVLSSIAKPLPTNKYSPPPSRNCSYPSSFEDGSIRPVWRQHHAALVFAAEWLRFRSRAEWSVCSQARCDQVNVSRWHTCFAMRRKR